MSNVDIALVARLTQNYRASTPVQRRALRVDLAERHAEDNRHLATLQAEIATTERAIALRTALLDAWAAIEAADHHTG